MITSCLLKCNTHLSSESTYGEKICFLEKLTYSFQMKRKLIKNLDKSFFAKETKKKKKKKESTQCFHQVSWNGNL